MIDQVVACPDIHSTPLNDGFACVVGGKALSTVFLSLLLVSPISTARYERVAHVCSTTDQHHIARGVETVVVTYRAEEAAWRSDV